MFIINKLKLIQQLRIGQEQVFRTGHYSYVLTEYYWALSPRTTWTKNNARRQLSVSVIQSIQMGEMNDTSMEGCAWVWTYRSYLLSAGRVS
jgi:hypothetical protein